MNKHFRTLGFVEGASLLVLLFIAMPIKYMAGIPEVVRVVGMIHGLLFIAYVFFAFSIASERKWPMSQLLTACVAAVIPFGPFVLDRRLSEFR